MSVIKLINRSNGFLWKTPLSLSKFSGISKFSNSAATQNKDPVDWVSIYRFPYVQFVAAANKLKLYQAAFTVFAVPASFFIPDSSPAVVAYIGITGFLTLSAASLALKDTVGFIYTSESRPELVKFSTVDYLGRRKDEIMNLDDITAFSEMKANPLEKYVTLLEFYNGHHKLKLFKNYGGIQDQNEFDRIFGEEH